MKYKKFKVLALLFIGTGLFLWNCQNDFKEPTEIQQEPSTFKFSIEKNISMPESAVSKQFKIPLQKKSFSNTGKGEVLDFQIITNSISKITSPTYEVFTFPVVSNSKQVDFQNLAVIKHDDDTLEYLMIDFIKEPDNTTNDPYKIEYKELDSDLNLIDPKLFAKGEVEPETESEADGSVRCYKPQWKHCGCPGGTNHPDHTSSVCRCGTGSSRVLVQVSCGCRYDPSACVHQPPEPACLGCSGGGSGGGNGTNPPSNGGGGGGAGSPNPTSNHYGTDICYPDGTCTPAIYIPLVSQPRPETLEEKLGLTPEESNFLNDVTNRNLKEAIQNFLNQNNFSDEAKGFANRAIKAIMDTTNDINTFEEFIESEINKELEIDPFKLLEIDCDQIRNWQTLAQHTAPQSVIDKIEDLRNNHSVMLGILGEWEIQYLSDAGGTVVNMDYFSVNITTLPNNSTTGQRFTPQQFLDYFRRNINDFVDDTTFEPYCEISAICQRETNLWNSSNPLGGIVKLDISLSASLIGGIVGNDGVVVCAEYTNNYWRFMTVEAPYDSSHPVSGTRQFGIERNANRSYSIYVRGVDRFTSRIQEIAVDAFLDDQFEKADELWESFQTKMNRFINNNGGRSTISTPTKERPDWNKVREVLEGRRPISDLGCD